MVVAACSEATGGEGSEDRRGLRPQQAVRRNYGELGRTGM